MLLQKRRGGAKRPCSFYQRRRLVNTPTIATRIAEPTTDQMMGNCCPSILTSSGSGKPSVRASQFTMTAPIRPTIPETGLPHNEYPARVLLMARSVHAGEAGDPKTRSRTGDLAPEGLNLIVPLARLQFCL